MVYLAVLASSSLLQAIILLSTFASTYSATIPSSTEETLREASLQHRWNVIHQHVGNTGMDLLCQAFLPLATATKTENVIFATPSTTTMTGFTTEVAVETVFQTSGVFGFTTKTIEKTAVITQTAPARRGLSNSLEKLFRALLADANTWTIAMCRKLEYDPLTTTAVETRTTYTPFVASTDTQVITEFSTSVTTALILESAVSTVQAISTVTRIVTVPNGRICPDKVSGAVSVARLLKTDLFGFDLPEKRGGGGTIGVSSETACILACSVIPGCSAYFWWPKFTSCYLKHPGWRSSDFYLDSQSAQDPGSVAGILRTTCEELRPSLTDDVFQRCCDN